MAERIFLTFCKFCKRKQQVLFWKEKIQGHRICVYCGMRFKIDKNNIIKEINITGGKNDS